MSSLLPRRQSPCDRFQEWLEESQMSPSALGHLEILLAAAPVTTVAPVVPAEHRAHADVCADCRAAAEDLLAIRELLRQAADVPVAGPWFAPRVMAAIASR